MYMNIGTPFTSLDEIKQANEQAHRHWFSKDTMRFFSSRIGARVYPDHSCRRTLFVSSEQPPHGPRHYSVRAAIWDTGHIETVGEFGAYRTGAQAHRAAQETAGT